MIVINKVLLCVFITLLLVIGVELFFYFQPNNIIISSIYSNKKPALTNSKAEICFPLKTKSQSVLNETLLEELKRLPNIAFVSSHVTNIRQGRIVDINVEGGSIPLDKNRYKNIDSSKYEYQILMKIKNEEDSDTLDFIWPKEMFTLKRVEIVQRTDDKEKSIQANELKIGDKVIVEQNVNLADKGCFKPTCSRYKIIKI